MLRNILKGGYRQIPGTFPSKFSNGDATLKIFTSLLLDNCSFIAHVICGENNRMTKRLPFNDDRKPLPPPENYFLPYHDT